MGGDCNAFTTKEYTTFYVRLLSEHLSLGLDILSDIMWDAGAAPRRRRGRAHGHPRRDPDARRRAGRPGGGAVAGRALPRARRSGATPSARPRRCSASPATTSAPSSTCTTGRPTWSSRWPATAPTRPWRPTWSGASPATSRRRRRRGRRPAPGPDTVALDVVRRSTEQAHLVYGMRSVSRVRRAPLGPGRARTMCSGAACRAASSRRCASSAAWPTRSGRSGRPTRTADRWPWWSGTAPEHVDEVLEIVDAELELLAADGVTDRELAVAKGNLRAEMLLSGEDSGARMSRLGASMLLHGEVLTGRRGAGPHRRDRAGRRPGGGGASWRRPRAR